MEKEEREIEKEGRETEKEEREIEKEEREMGKEEREIEKEEREITRDTGSNLEFSPVRIRISGSEGLVLHEGANHFTCHCPTKHIPIPLID